MIGSWWLAGGAMPAAAPTWIKSYSDISSATLPRDLHARPPKTEDYRRCQMAGKAKKPSRLTAALLETAQDMRDGGLLDASAYNKITMRHLEAVGAPPGLRECAAPQGGVTQSENSAMASEPHPASLRSSTLPEDGEG
jgi:hypothetical protein